MLSSLRLAMEFFMPLGGRRPAPDAAEMRKAARWFGPIAVLLGVTWMVVFNTAWGRFGELTGIRLMPSAAVVLVMGLVVQVKWWIGLGATIDRLAGCSGPEALKSRTWPELHAVGLLGLVILVLFWLAALLSARGSLLWTPPPWGLSAVAWIRPLFPRDILRVVALTPVWGLWAVAAAASMARAANLDDPAMEGVGRAISPLRLLRLLLLPVVLTGLAFPQEALGLVMSLSTMAGTFLICILIGWRIQGHTRWSALGCGALVQILFLATYAMLGWRR